MSQEINAEIGGLQLPGEPAQLREGARKLDEVIHELNEVRRILRETELGHGGRLHRFVGTLHAQFEATRHSLNKDADLLGDVRDRARELARVVDDLQSHDVPAILNRWQRVRGEAIAGGARADARVADVERDLVEQYRDVLVRLGGQKVVHDIEAAHWVEQPHAAANGGHGGGHGGHATRGGGDMLVDHLGGGDPEGRVQIYRHTLAGILEDLDHALRRWRAEKREVAQALHAAKPVAIEVHKHGGRAVEQDGDHDNLKDILESLQQANAPLQQANAALKEAVSDLRQGRRGQGPLHAAHGGAAFAAVDDDADDAQHGDGHGWQLGHFHDQWSQHIDQLDDRVKRTVKAITDVREEFRALDEKFAAALGD